LYQVSSHTYFISSLGDLVVTTPGSSCSREIRVRQGA